MSDYPYTIDNGAGERLTFLSTGSDEQGDYLEGEDSVVTGQQAHRCMSTTCRRRRSRSRAGRWAGSDSGRRSTLARSGRDGQLWPGKAHRFWNAGDDELICTGYVRPPDNLEYFLTQIFASTKAQRR